MPQEWTAYAKPGPYITRLSPQEEAQFKTWVAQNKIPWQDSPTSDYDMRGYWKALVSGNPRARTEINPVDQKPHYPDTWKTPYHKTFSRESEYALPTAGHWEGQTFVPPNKTTMPQTVQNTYVALPDGSYVQIPPNATPEQLNSFRERLRSFSVARNWWEAPKTEAAQVAARPGVTPDQAKFKEQVSKPITDLREKAFSIFTPTGDVPPEQLEATRKAQQFVTETGGAMLGAEAVEPGIAAVKGAPRVASWLLPKVMRAAGAGAGAATGSAVSGEPPKEAGKTGAAFGATELGGDIGLGALRSLYRVFSDPKLTMQQASEMIANKLSEEGLSPNQFAKGLQESFDYIRTSAGQAKDAFISAVGREHPDVTVDYRNTQDVLKTWVNNLNFMKSHNPALFAQGEGLNKTLNILSDELNSTNGEIAAIKNQMKSGNLAEADLRRSQFWNYKQQLDPSLASRVVGDLDRASTQDIATALARKNRTLARDYLSLSNRYKQLSDLGRESALRKVFGNKRISTDKVVSILNTVPEDSLRAVRAMKLENSMEGARDVQNLRRALFEESVKTSGVKGLFKLQPSLVREIYGPQADGISQFVEVVNRKSGGDTLLTKLPGKYGAAFRIAEGMNRPGITIRASELAKILDNMGMVRAFTLAAEMPANAGPATMLRETLERAIAAAGVQPETPAGSTRRPVWAQPEAP
jgi:hypothetical protein